MIHSTNPQPRPEGIVRPSSLFKSRKTKQQKTMFATGVTVGLTEWIIDDTCNFLIIFSKIYAGLTLISKRVILICKSSTRLNESKFFPIHRHFFVQLLRPWYICTSGQILGIQKFFLGTFFCLTEKRIVCLERVKCHGQKTWSTSMAIKQLYVHLTLFYSLLVLQPFNLFFFGKWTIYATTIHASKIFR